MEVQDNISKAREIADEIDYRNGRGWYDHCEIIELSYNSAMEMAKWKDEQMKEYLLQKKDGLKWRSDIIGKYHDVCTELIEEISKDLGL